jgi:hypothetical protein
MSEKVNLRNPKSQKENMKPKKSATSLDLSAFGAYLVYLLFKYKVITNIKL